MQEATLLAHRRRGGQREMYDQDCKTLMERAGQFYRDFGTCCAGWVATPPAEVKLPKAPEVLEAEGEDEAGASFILSVTDRGRATRPHKADGCRRASALAFKHYTLVHDTFVDESRYHLICKDCFPQDRLPKGPPSGNTAVDAAAAGGEGTAEGLPGIDDSSSATSDSASGSDEVSD